MSGFCQVTRQSGDGPTVTHVQSCPPAPSQLILLTSHRDTPAQKLQGSQKKLKLSWAPEPSPSAPNPPLPCPRLYKHELKPSQTTYSVTRVIVTRASFLPLDAMNLPLQVAPLV